MIDSRPQPYAPKPGTDPEFDKIMQSVAEAMASDPEAAKYDDRTRRETIAKAMSKFGGKTYVPDDADLPWEDKDGNPAPNDVPRTLQVPPQATDFYWYESPSDAKMFDHYILSRVALGARLPGGLLITGPAGTGKTRGVSEGLTRLNAAHPELGLPLLVMNCPTVTDEQKWFGRREVDKDGTHYVKSEFVSAVENGAVILLDEFMRLHPRIHNNVMSLLDGQESVLLSDLGVTITRHPKTAFIGTTNQGAQFGGTHRMDWAMRERWAFTIERGFPPIDEEVRILTSHNPGCDEDAARVLVDIADKSRSLWESGDLRSPISPRTLDNAAFLVASGMTEREALEFTAIPEYDAGAEGIVGQESERAKVRGIIDGRTGR